MPGRPPGRVGRRALRTERERSGPGSAGSCRAPCHRPAPRPVGGRTASSARRTPRDRKSTRLNSSHVAISYAVFCLKKKKINDTNNDIALLKYFMVDCKEQVQ